MEKEKLKQISIIDVALRLGIKVNRDNKALCFMHDERTASLSFYKKNNTFKCFGCDKGGDVIKLVSEYNRMDFKNACTWLEYNFIADRPIVAQQRKKEIMPPKKDTPTPQPNIQIFNWIIEKAGLSEQTKSYLQKKRKLTEESISKYRIKEVGQPAELQRQLLNNWSEKDLVDCGLMNIKEGRRQFIWRGRVILFPFLNNLGDTEYIQARAIEGKTKYINLYGLNKPMYNRQKLSLLPPGSDIIICEGILDTITMEQLRKDAVGILGASSFQNTYIRELIDLNIYVLPDNDDSGQKLFKKIEREFASIGKPVKKIEVPKGYKDINEFYTANSGDQQSVLGLGES